MLEFFGLGAPDFIDRLSELLGDVEPVQHIESGGQHLRDDVEVGFPHVGADHLDPGAALGTELLEEAGEGLGLPVLDHSEQALDPLVDLVNERHVFVPETVADFIHVDAGDVFQVPVFQPIIVHPLDRPPT